MRTPGHDAELAAGFLFTEGILHSSSEIAGIELDGERRNTIHVRTSPGCEIDYERLERHFYTSSSCGVCGKTSIDAVRTAGCPMLPAGAPRVNAAVINALPDRLRAAQAVFDRTGGLHAAALFTAAGEFVDLREDVGRHNALDKLIGSALLAGQVPLGEHILLVSGRTSFELIQKSVMAGIAVVAAVGAPSSLAVETAQRFGQTLAGFVRDGRFNLYSGSERIVL